MNTLREEYAKGLARAIIKDASAYGLNPEKVKENPNNAVERYSSALADKMLTAAQENGARSINMSNALRGALTRAGYARTYKGLAEALKEGEK